MGVVAYICVHVCVGEGDIHVGERGGERLSLIQISEPTRLRYVSRMQSSA